MSDTITTDDITMWLKDYIRLNSADECTYIILHDDHSGSIISGEDEDGDDVDVISFQSKEGLRGIMLKGPAMTNEWKPTHKTLSGVPVMFVGRANDFGCLLCEHESGERLYSNPTNLTPIPPEPKVVTRCYYRPSRKIAYYNNSGWPHAEDIELIGIADHEPVHDPAGNPLVLTAKDAHNLINRLGLDHPDMFVPFVRKAGGK